MCPNTFFKGFKILLQTFSSDKQLFQIRPIFHNQVHVMMEGEKKAKQKQKQKTTADRKNLAQESTSVRLQI